jgi:peroxiredoxin
MIQRSGISLNWQWAASFLVVIAIAGCNKSAPEPEASPAPLPSFASPSQATTAEPVAEVADPEMSPAAEVSASEVAASDSTSPTEVKPAVAEPKPIESSPAPGAMKKPKVAFTVPDPPDYVYAPEVLMAERDAAACLLKTGEIFPDGQLSDLEGQAHSLKELFGEKLTVVVFWANEHRLGLEQIQRLQAETVVPFENAGVSVIAINISDSPEQIADLLPTDAEIGFAVLLDTDAALFAKVATGRHPRTYLLDADGKILWFDIEYSRGTARDLANAIHVYLGNRKIGDS